MTLRTKVSPRGSLRAARDLATEQMLAALADQEARTQGSTNERNGIVFVGTRVRDYQFGDHVTARCRS